MVFLEVGHSLAYGMQNHCSLQDLRVLITWGADLTAKIGSSPIPHYAIRNNSSELVRILVNNGAPTNSQDEHGNTPLHIALEKNDENILRFLVNSGANINIKNNQGVSPLQKVITKGNVDLVRFFLHCGSIIELSSIFNWAYQNPNKAVSKYVTNF